MLDAAFRPLPQWNRKPALQFRHAPFRTPALKTLDAIEYELGRLSAHDVRIEAGFALSQLRNDGWPRAGERPSHPGVVLYFESPEGSLCFPCGTYADYYDNLHAIALTLENLRAIDRYGVTLGHEQYRGFAQIEAPKKMTAEEAAAWCALNTPLEPARVLRDASAWRDVYRLMASKCHPDRGGDRANWDKLQEARKVLDVHHGLTKGASG
jgi:hypothetical protein